jgi:hypothetical protein
MAVHTGAVRPGMQPAAQPYPGYHGQ